MIKIGIALGKLIKIGIALGKLIKIGIALEKSPTRLERSRNTVLLASTQAVYKAPHSTVQKDTQSDTVTVAVGSLRA